MVEARAVCSSAPGISQMLPGLTVAACAALATDPATILARWFDSLGEAARAKYRRALLQFGSWATGAEQPPERVLGLLVDAGRVGARQLALGWRDQLATDGKASGTIAGLLSGLAGCISAARFAGLVDWQLERVAPKVEPRLDRSGPPRGDVSRLLEHLDALDDDRAVRDTAIVRLLHGAALRLNEVCSLRACDLQLDADGGPAVLALRKGKHERERMLIGPLAAASLRRWLDRRAAGDATTPVFVELKSRAGGAAALTGESVRRMLRSRAKQAGVRATIRPHGLRHTAASHVARTGSVAQVKRLGGWTTLTSPARYLDRCDVDRQSAMALVEV